MEAKLDLSKVAVVVLAAGYGQLRKGVTKLVEKLNEKEILCRVVSQAKQAGLGPVVVVANGMFGQEVKQALVKAEHIDLHFAHQKKRRGPANAAFRALPVLNQLGIKKFLVVFGDMPLLDAGRMREMAAAHLQYNSDLTFSSWKCDVSNPLVRHMVNFAYFVRSGDCGLSSTPVVVSLYTGNMPPQGSEVFSSMYCLDAQWFTKAYRRIIPRPKGDGFPPEYHLPPLVEIAVASSAKVVNISECDPKRLLGVNTFADHELIETLLNTQPALVQAATLEGP